MELYGCWGFTRLDIGSTSLRKLVVGDYWAFWRRENQIALEIFAPNLQSLGIFGKIHRNRFRLMNIQSLDDCYLNFEVKTSVEDYNNDFEELRYMVGELLDRLRHVKKLTMGNWCIQVT
ncbi:hypothetical protein L1049_017836 [Liquidambar formosana]|uniref:Uncharacterized protein n=1 Tax=Liquidambar formosana TaxID=63359 RepID=A0AAP0R8S6_LIQFO